MKPSYYKSMCPWVLLVAGCDALRAGGVAHRSSTAARTCIPKAAVRGRGAQKDLPLSPGKGMPKKRRPPGTGFRLDWAPFDSEAQLEAARRNKAVQAIEASEASIFAAGGVAWVALGVAALAGGPASSFLELAFGFTTSSLEESLRNPAHGFLELTGPLLVLEGAILLALSRRARVGNESSRGPGRPSSTPWPPSSQSSSDLAARGQLGISLDDTARLGAALLLTSLSTLGALAVTLLSGGASVVALPPVAAVVALVVATAFLGDGLIGAVDEANPLTPSDVLALCARDARELLVGANVEGGSVEGGKINTLSLFYRSSALLGILVGASFALSPIDPIGIFDEEGAVSTLMRQICGVYLAFLLAPIETILYRAVQRGALSEPPVRALNAVVGFSDLLLIVDCRGQVDSSAAQFTALQQDEPSLSLLALVGEVGDVARSETNTNAAFAVGLGVALLYLWQALLAPSESDTSRT